MFNGILGLKRMSKNFNSVLFKSMKTDFYYPLLMNYFEDHYALHVFIMKYSTSMESPSLAALGVLQNGCMGQ